MIQAELIATQDNQALSQHLQQEIYQQNGKISFAWFMQQALYAPGLGYYSAPTQKFGAYGDFVTAPEIGNLFAQCLAQQCIDIFADTSTNCILELGAGSGQLAVDLLMTLQQANVSIQNYYILEISAELQQRQQEKILSLCPAYAPIVQWLTALPDHQFNGVIIANEVMDAMPVNIFHFANNKLQEYYVQYFNQQFTYVLDEPSEELAHFFHGKNLANLISQPYSSEINLWLAPWIKSLAACLGTGAIILFDYGFGRTEYYHPQRNSGTLMCHYRHHNNANPLINIGRQDITAHVDFTTVAETAIDCGMHIAGYTNLACFLINCGLLDLIQTPKPTQNHEINILTSPAEMGELFKVIALTKKPDAQLKGFRNYNKVYSL